MEPQKPKDTNNLSELEQKHWPQIEAVNPKTGTKFVVKVKIGVIPHPMTEEHQIVFIEVFYGNQPVGKKFLKPGDEPEAEFIIDAKDAQKIRAQEFCNLHGLWENEIEIKFK